MMTNLKKILAISSIVVVLLLDVVTYSVFKTPAAASGPIMAIPLASTDTASANPTTLTHAMSTIIGSAS